MNEKKPMIYLISGPPGAGKSTTSRALAERLGMSALIDGDDVYHMVIGGARRPWESPFHIRLMWRNIAALAHGFIESGHDVVINYVVFREDIGLFIEALGGLADETAMKFILLVADEDELRRRDAERKPEHRMGERCGIVLHELLADGPSEASILDTSALSLEQTVDAIIASGRFALGSSLR
ncbi:AAA family ATPase [Paenibacillus lycopersici]|uniref:AAA family ATPase n=1 Tax=Paenibacillus lycopersici TaxID=2704462 RepID=A0A6C0G4G4_9BACL|nr:AAA family ATPase [Paenibacillus lycopersici]QHT63053.1 AAA family ATPase [Paenibacillus lycopersici]